MNKSLYRRGFLASLAGGAGIYTLLAATTDKTGRTAKTVRIAQFDANGVKTGVEEVAKMVVNRDY